MSIVFLIGLILLCILCAIFVLSDSFLMENERRVGNIFKIIACVLTLWLIIACNSPWNNEYEYISFGEDSKITKIYNGNKIIGFRIKSSDNKYEIKAIKDAVYLDYNGKWKKIENSDIAKFILNNLNNEKLNITIEIIKYNCVRGIDFLIEDDIKIVNKKEE